MTDLAVFLRGKEELSFPRSPWREIIVTYRSGSRRIDLDHLYRMMDFLAEQKEKKEAAFSLQLAGLRCSQLNKGREKMETNWLFPSFQQIHF